MIRIDKCGKCLKECHTAVKKSFIHYLSKGEKASTEKKDKRRDQSLCQIFNTHVKTWANSLVVKEIQIKAIFCRYNTGASLSLIIPGLGEG